MEYLNIIEENFTKSDYVAYLRGSILMWLLEDKPLDIPRFKLYANKLVEIMEEQPTVDPDEPKVIKEHEFKLGDHVIISKGSIDERTGVIVRLPMDGVDCRYSYIVDLDDKDLGWTATVDVDGVDCKNAWVTSSSAMELLPTTLKTNTWYHTKDFTLEELKELLPSGTHLQVEKQVLYDGIKTTPPTETRAATVKSVTTSFLTEEPLIETTGGTFLKEWFMLQGEK